MNEQLQKALSDLLGKTINGIDTTVNFMQAQLPDVIQQLLVWYVVKGLFVALFGLFLMIPLILLLVKLSKVDIAGATEDSFWVEHYGQSGNTIGIGCFASLLASSVAFVLGALFFMFNILEPVQIWIAPKIWLIEYASSLAK
ncbi:hypothetical protein [Vibrio casei]|uniref:hypothetical protein n=1 Tax=Vibrio casei TaxID=673372 RepID=UPI003F9DDD9C